MAEKNVNSQKTPKKEYHIRIMVTEDEEKAIKNAEFVLKHRYKLQRSKLLKTFLCEGMLNRTILLLLGYFSKERS